jgi:hypothetical protein
MDNYQKGP